MSTEVPTIRTERLELVSMSVGFMRAVLSRDVEAAKRELGVEIPADLPDQLEHLFTYRLAQLDADPTILPWLARAMVLGDPTGQRRMIGTIGFHGAPDALGRLEVGYRIEPEHQRRGYTCEAVRGMFDSAATEHGMHRFIASVRPDNEASLGLVRGLGFVQTGTQMDEIDGLELVLEAEWAPPGSSRAIP